MASILDSMQDGIVVPVLRYTVYNYAQLTASTETIIVADRIPVAPFARIGLSLRVHKKNIATGGSFQFHIYGVNPSDEDGADFVSASLGSVAAITGVSATPSLVQLTSIISDVQHPMIRVGMTIVGSTASGFVYGVFSADLVMRCSG